jgi:hypothetical protein
MQTKNSSSRIRRRKDDYVCWFCVVRPLYFSAFPSVKIGKDSFTTLTNSFCPFNSTNKM